ncbi:MAG: hypothetical protein ABI047_04350 [Jatrophihabitantaceae bacterium]
MLAWIDAGRVATRLAADWAARAFGDAVGGAAVAGLVLSAMPVTASADMPSAATVAVRRRGVRGMGDLLEG